MDADRRHEVVDLLDNGRFKEVLLILNKSIKQESAKDPEAFYLLGVAHFRLGDFSTAESELRKAISLDPSRADAFYYLGLAAERQMRKDDALKAYKTALALDPTLEKAREKVGKLSGGGIDASSNTIGRKAGAKQAESELSSPKSELSLPRNEAEFRDYESGRRRKAEIDQRAERDAQVKLLHELPRVISQYPWWVKVGSAVFMGFFVLLLIMFLGGFGKSGSEEVERLVEEARRKQESAGGHQEEANKVFCDQARRLGHTPPGC